MNKHHKAGMLAVLYVIGVAAFIALIGPVGLVVTVILGSAYFVGYALSVERSIRL